MRAALDDILSRDYFNRLWVVQEAALSWRTRLFAGSANTIWTAGSSAFRFLKGMKFAATTPEWEKAGLSDVDLTPLEDVLELEVRGVDKKGTWPESEVVDVAYAMSHRQCVNPHDRIYGVLGLASDGAAIQPDYTIPVEETFKDLYRYIRVNYLGDQYKVMVRLRKFIVLDCAVLPVSRRGNRLRNFACA